jgi:hypothetical protein
LPEEVAALLNARKNVGHAQRECHSGVGNFSHLGNLQPRAALDVSFGRLQDYVTGGRDFSGNYKPPA